MNDRIKAGLGISAVAGVGYGLGRGIEFLGKKIFKKVKEIKEKKAEENNTEK